MKVSLLEFQLMRLSYTMLNNFFCTICYQESRYRSTSSKSESLYCNICKCMILHSPGKIKYCTICDNQRVIGPNSLDLTFCPKCKADTIHLEEEEKEDTYDYVCEKCGHEIEHDEDSDNILHDCGICGRYSNFLRKENNMGRKKHRKHRNTVTKIFYCQDCCHEITEHNTYSKTICLWRHCPECKKQKEFKPSKPELAVPDQIIEKYFKVYPLPHTKEVETEEVELSLYE